MPVFYHSLFPFCYGCLLANWQLYESGLSTIAFTVFTGVLDSYYLLGLLKVFWPRYSIEVFSGRIVLFETLIIGGNMFAGFTGQSFFCNDNFFKQLMPVVEGFFDPSNIHYRPFLLLFLQILIFDFECLESQKDVLSMSFWLEALSKQSWSSEHFGVLSYYFDFGILQDDNSSWMHQVWWIALFSLLGKLVFGFQLHGDDRLRVAPIVLV